MAKDFRSISEKENSPATRLAGYPIKQVGMEARELWEYKLQLMQELQLVEDWIAECQVLRDKSIKQAA